jgi:hypothetical protein
VSLSKRGRIWYAEIRFAGQRRREAVGPRKEEAAAVLAKWKEEIRHGDRDHAPRTPSGRSRRGAGAPR